MSKQKSDRVSLRADDAIIALQSLRSSVESLHGLVLRCPGEAIKEIREEKWQAYQRIAKALGLKPTLSTTNSEVNGRPLSYAEIREQETDENDVREI